MTKKGISVACMLALLVAFFVCSVGAQENPPPDANKIKTPQEAFKGGSGLYFIQRGFEDLKKGANEEAVKNFRKGIELKPNYADAYEGLGRAQGNLKLWPDAIASFKKAIRLKPDFVHAYVNLGFANGMINQYQEALKAFKKAAQLNPRLAIAHWGLATTYLALGDREAALREHKIIKTLDPEMAKRFEKYLK
jgi:tetratricopeptide (TPR) repeat protein